MKKSKLFLFGLLTAILAGALVLAGCEGPAGPAGSPGAPGTPGTSGTGENGEPIISSVFGAVDEAALAAAFSIYNEVGVIGGEITLTGNALVPAGKILNLYGDVLLDTGASAFNVKGTLNIKNGARLATNGGADDSIVVEEGGLINIAAGEADDENPITGSALSLTGNDDTLTVEDGGHVSVGARALLFYAGSVEQIIATLSSGGDTDAAGTIGKEGERFAGVSQQGSNAKIEIATDGFIGTGLGGGTDTEKLDVSELLKVAGNVYFGGSLNFKDDLGGTVAANDPLTLEKTLVVNGDVTSAASTTGGDINLRLWIDGNLNTTNMTGPNFKKAVNVKFNATVTTATKFEGATRIGGDLTVSAALTVTNAVFADTIIVGGSGSIAAGSIAVATKNFESQTATPITSGTVSVEGGGEVIVSGSGTITGLGIDSTLLLPGSGYKVFTGISAATTVKDVLAMGKVEKVNSRLTSAFGTSGTSFEVPTGKILEVAAGGSQDDYFDVAGVLLYTGNAIRLSGKIDTGWAPEQDGTNDTLFVEGAGQVVLYSDLTVNMAGAVGDTTKQKIAPRIVVPGRTVLYVGATDAGAATYVEFTNRLDVHFDGLVEVIGANEDATAPATLVLAAGGIIDGELRVTGGNGGPSTNTGTAAAGPAGSAATVTVTGADSVLRINGIAARATPAPADGGTDDGLGAGEAGTLNAVTGGNIVITGGTGGVSSEAESGGAGGAATVTAVLKGKGGVAIGGGGGGGANTTVTAVGGAGGAAKLVATGITVTGGASSAGGAGAAGATSAEAGAVGGTPVQVKYTGLDGFSGTIAVAGGGAGGVDASVDSAGKDGSGGAASVAGS